jgi:hypothetical protein
MSDTEDEYLMVGDAHVSEVYNEQHAYVANTTIQKALKQGVGTYNADLKPLQHPLLKNGWTEIENPVHRELAYLYSQFVETHTDGIIEEIVARGWTYEEKKKPGDPKEEPAEVVPEDPTDLESPPEPEANAIDVPSTPQDEAAPEDPPDQIGAIPAPKPNPLADVEWNESLKDAFKSCYSVGLCVDTAFICEFGDEGEDNWEFTTFSRNWVRDAKYKSKSKSRNITRVQLEYPKWEGITDEDGETDMQDLFWFITQHGEDAGTIERETPEPTDGDDEEEDEPGRAVIFTPRKSITCAWGEPVMRKVIFVGLMKLFLRFYEFLYMHKGGVNTKLWAVNEGVDANSYKKVRNDIMRGLLSMGATVKLPQNSDLKEQFEYVETVCGAMDWEIWNSHLSEESFLPKQSVEGQAATGALGGEAPKVEKQEHDQTVTEWEVYARRLIKAINQRFFGKDPKEYEVVFNRPAQINPLEANAKEGTPFGKKDEEEMGDDPKKPPKEEEDEENAAPEQLLHGAPIKLTGGKQVKKNGKKVYRYKGNMFDAGVYDYPDKNKKVVYYKDEIKDMTERPVKTGYMTVRHDKSQAAIGLGDDAGFYEVQGFKDISPSRGRDETIFYTYEDHGETITVSPDFYHRKTPTGRKQLYVQNVAIVPQSRASLTGLDTTATQT